MGEDRDVEVDGLREVRLDDGAGAVVGRGLDERPGRGQVVGDLDADARAAKARLHDVRPRKGRPVADAERDARERGQPSGVHHSGERQLVHPESRSRGARSRVPQAGEVECRLQGAVLARSTVTAVDDGADVERPAAAEATGLGDEPTAGPSHEVEAVRATGDTFHEGRGLEGRIDLEEVTRPRPIDRGDLDAVLGERTRSLQPREHADVVFGARASEQHGGTGHPNMLAGGGADLRDSNADLRYSGPEITGNGPAGRSRRARRPRP